MELKVFLRSTENRSFMFFCVYVYFWGEDDENTLVGALLPPDCTMSMTIAGVTKPERTAETGLCVCRETCL